MSRIRVIALAASLSLLAGLSLAHAQQPSTLRADIVGVKDGDYPNARAVVNVDDASGAIDGLSKDNFTVTVDGKPAAVVTADLASSQNLPLDVLFVIDISGSMAGEPMSRTKEAAKGFLSGLAPTDRVALLTFADEVRLDQDYSTDRAATSAAIDGLVAAGNTALYQATANTAIKVTTSDASRRAVIFLSDGAQDGVPLTAPRDVAIAAAGSVGVPFFTIGEGKGIDREYLQQLATVTGGRYLEAPDPKDLGTLYDGIGKLLRSQYAVTFDASVASDAGSRIAITLRSGEASTTAAVTYKPSSSFAPPPIKIAGLQPGDTLSEARTITIDTGAVPTRARASFYVDSVNVFESVQPPYTFVFDPHTFPGGAHTLRVSLEGAGKASEASVSFSSVASAPPPASGGLPTMPIAVGAGIGLLLAIGTFVGFRVRAAQRDEAPNLDRVVPVAKPLLTRGLPPSDLVQDDSSPAEVVVEPLGVLISRGGSDLGSEYAVGANPVSIGSGARCAVRVNDAELTAEEARTWIRKGHLMLHRMTRLTAMVVDGTSGGWEILEPGDTFSIGAHVFEFRLLPPGQLPSATGAGAIPNILRDPTPPPPPTPEARPGLTDLMPRND